MKKNPSKAKHETYAKSALRAAKRALKQAEKTAASDVRSTAFALSAINESTRAFWNAYDAGDAKTANEAASVNAKSQRIVFTNAGFPPQRHLLDSEVAAAAIYGVSISKNQSNPSDATCRICEHFTIDPEDAKENPYQGDAIQSAKQRKYGYPKPPSPKNKKNPKTKAPKKNKGKAAGILRRAMS